MFNTRNITNAKCNAICLIELLSLTYILHFLLPTMLKIILGNVDYNYLPLYDYTYNILDNEYMNDRYS